MKPLLQPFRSVLFALLSIQVCFGSTFVLFDRATICDCTQCDSCTSDGTSDSDRCNEFDHSCNCASTPQKADLTPAAVTVNHRTILNGSFHAPVVCLASFNNQIETVSVVKKQFVLPTSPPHLSSTILRI